MAMSLEIREDDLTSPAIAAFLQEHLEFTAQQSPRESMHALDLAGLQAADVTFWSAWYGEDLAGCGALKELDPAHGEIKSMRTTPHFLRRGVASAILRHIMDRARQRGYQRISLETGSMEAFAPARALYARFGFQVCQPFANYVLDPNSVFMTQEL